MFGRIDIFTKRLEENNSCSAAYALGEIKVKSAVGPLIEALYKDNECAAAALGSIRDNRAVIPLSKVLSSSNYNIRVSAAEILGNFGDKRAVPYLTKSLEIEKENEVRKRIVKTLGKLGDERAIFPILQERFTSYGRNNSEYEKTLKEAIKLIIDENKDSNSVSIKYAKKALYGGHW